MVAPNRAEDTAARSPAEKRPAEARPRNRPQDDRAGLACHCKARTFSHSQECWNDPRDKPSGNRRAQCSREAPCSGLGHATGRGRMRQASPDAARRERSPIPESIGVTETQRAAADQSRGEDRGHGGEARSGAHGSKQERGAIAPLSPDNRGREHSHILENVGMIETERVTDGQPCGQEREHTYEARPWGLAVDRHTGRWVGRRPTPGSSDILIFSRM